MNGWDVVARTATSKTQAVMEDIAGQIRQGVLRPGDRLPGRAELCSRYGVSSIVVRNAIQWLKAVGLVEGVAGMGIFVAQPSS